ncbi:NUDIX hydrolase [Paucisalibacillus globulus]|uniref:NUDIX hydrolase n=1 Tax=Paucisalibacillus globulus TaxID=351095 RepID=UPI0004187D3E|nr:NUDIX hydrolase [Paucisalibacillus globulus]
MGYIEELRKLVGQRPLIFVGAVAVITDNEGRILLQQRRFPNGVWGIPGGLMELGESTEDVARREVLEETGLTIGELNLINVYSGKDHFIVAENGDQFYVVTIAYHTNEYEGDLDIDKSESIKFEFFYPEYFPEKMVGSHRQILKEYLSSKGDGY